MAERQLDDQLDNWQEDELSTVFAQMKQECKELAADVIPPKLQELLLLRTNLVDAIAKGDPLRKDFQENVLGKEMSLASYRAREDQIKNNLSDQFANAAGLRSGFDWYCGTTLKQIERQYIYLKDEILTKAKDPVFKAKVSSEIKTLEEIEGRLQIIRADWNVVFEYVKWMIEDKKNELKYKMLQHDPYYNNYPGSKKDAKYQSYLAKLEDAEIYAKSWTPKDRKNSAQYVGSFNPRNCTNTRASLAAEHATLEGYYERAEASSQKKKEIEKRDTSVVLEVPDPYELLKSIISDIEKSKTSTKQLWIVTDRLDK